MSERGPLEEWVPARERARLESTAAAIVGDREAAKDIASDAVLALTERASDPPRAPVAWLVTATRNRARNHVRARIRAERRLARLIERPGEIPTPYDPRIRTLLDRALIRLNERDRLAITARVIHEHSIDTLAEQLGTTPAHARLIAHRAIRRLRRETLALLADHHGLPTSCRRTLLGTGRVTDHGCGPCGRVADELAGLSASGLLPVAAVPHLAKRLMTGMPRLTARAEHQPARAAEVLAAVALSVAMAVIPATPSAERHGTTTLATATDPASGRDASVPMALAPPGATAGFSDVMRLSDEEGGGGLGVGSGDLSLFDLRITVPDALDSAAPPSLDLRSLEIATVRDRHGTARGVRFAIELRGLPRADDQYGIRWDFPGKQCEGTVSSVGDSEEQRYEVPDAEVGPIGMTGGDVTSGGQDRAFLVRLVCGDPGHSADSPYWEPRSGYGQTEQTFEAATTVTGRRLLAVIRFDRVEGRFRELLAPGATLEGVRAYTTTLAPGANAFQGDYAPDAQRGVGYRIGA